MSIMRSDLKVLGALALMPACTVENNGSIAILENGLADISPGGGCLFDPEPEASLSNGILDVSRGDSYLMGPVVHNRMRETSTQRQPTTGTEVETTTERNFFTVRSFEVEMEALCSAEADAACATVAAIVNTAVRVPGAASVAPGATVSVPIDAIPRAISAALRDSGGLSEAIGPTVRLSLRAVGGRNNEEEIESGTFEYFVDLCEGCLVRGLNPRIECPGGTSEGYCGHAQDAFLDCCFVGTQEFCPASTAPATP